MQCVPVPGSRSLPSMRQDSDPLTPTMLEIAAMRLDRAEIVATCARSHLYGRYWDEHALTLRPELEFCGSDGAHGMLQDFQDTLPAEERKDDFWEWDGTDRYRDYVQSWAEARFEGCLARLLQVVAANERIEISRSMVVGASHLEQLRGSVGSDVDVAEVGVFWAAGDGMTGVYFTGDQEGAEVGLTAEVDIEAVDLRMTLLARMDYQNGDEEGEIRLRPEARLRLLGVTESEPAPSRPAFAA